MEVPGSGEYAGHQVQIYCNPDRNPRQILCRSRARKLTDALRALLPNKKILSKEDGSASLDFTLVAKAQPVAADSMHRRASRAGIFPTAFSKLGTSREALIKRYAELAGGTGPEATEDLEEVDF